MEADPAWITICNRLMRKFDQEMSGEMRKDYYASATQFYFSGDCAEASKPRFLLVARAGIEPATHGFSVRCVIRDVTLKSLLNFVYNLPSRHYGVGVH